MLPRTSLYPSSISKKRSADLVLHSSSTPYTFWVPTLRKQPTSTSTTQEPKVGQHNPSPLAVSILRRSKPSLTTTQTSSVRNNTHLSPRFFSHSPDALSKGELWSLDMASLNAAQSSAIPWTDNEAADLPTARRRSTPPQEVKRAVTADYDPVMAIAQNHIFFFGVPNIPAGQAPIFVIHCQSGNSLHLPSLTPFVCSRVLATHSAGIRKLP